MQGVASPAAVRERPSVAAARDHPLLVATLVCAALAAISAGVLPTVPSYDPWSWVVWGREVFDPHLGFFVGGGPSWKPLPVVFTAVVWCTGIVLVCRMPRQSSVHCLNDFCQPKAIRPTIKISSQTRRTGISGPAENVK